MTTNLSDELNQLAIKKRALERTLCVARTVESLYQSLNMAVVLSKPVRSLPAHALKLYDALSELAQLQPTVKIIKTIAKLDSVIQSDLSKIMDVVGSEQMGGADNEVQDLRVFLSNIDKWIEEYRKSAQTAVALRILLKKRNVPTKPLEYSIPDEVLRSSLKTISQKEKHYRTLVETEMQRLVEDTDEIINNEQATQNSRSIAIEMKTILSANIAHLKEGKDINDMPMQIEVVLITSDVTPQERIKSIPKQVFNETRHVAKVSSPSIGFFTKLWEWIRNPFDATWEDVNNKYK